MPPSEDAEEQARESFDRTTSGDDAQADTSAPFPPGLSGDELNETTRRIAQEDE